MSNIEKSYSNIKLSLESMKGVQRVIAMIAITTIAITGCVFLVIDIKTSFAGFGDWVVRNLRWPVGTLLITQVAVAVLPSALQSGFIASLISGEEFENENLNFIVRVVEHPIYKSLAVVAFLIDCGCDIWQLHTPGDLYSFVKAGVIVIALFTFFSEAVMIFFVPLAWVMWKAQLEHVMAKFAMASGNDATKRKIGFSEMMGVTPVSHQVAKYKNENDNDGGRQPSGRR